MGDAGIPTTSNSNGYSNRSYHDGFEHHDSANLSNDCSAAPLRGTNFEIFEWYPAYQSCQKYFLDHSQHENTVQAVAAFINISLPLQWRTNPIISFGAQSPHFSGSATQFIPGLSSSPARRTGSSVSLVPYIRRLVVTGFDREAILHGFFGDDWCKGVGPIQECERRNYLFAAKSGGWGKVKNQYDMGSHQTVPFLQPLQNVQLAEIESAEKEWSKWLAMEDWMVGPRAPSDEEDYTRMSDAGRS